MPEVEPTDQHGSIASRTDQNVFETEKLTYVINTPVSVKPSVMEPWLLLKHAMVIGIALLLERTEMAISRGILGEITCCSTRINF